MVARSKVTVGPRKTAGQKRTASKPSDPIDRERHGFSRYHVEALARALKVLAVFDGDRFFLSLSEVAAATGDNSATTLRVVATLVDLEMLAVDVETGKYFPSINSVKLGYNSFVNKDILNVAYPILKQLHRQIEESVYFGMLFGSEVVDMISFQRHQLIGTYGQRFPLTCTPGGKLALALCDEPQRRKILQSADFTPLGPKTLTRKELERQVPEIAKNQVAYAFEELAPGLSGAGVPVHDRDGNFVAYVVSSGPIGRLTPKFLREEIVPKLREAAGKISVLVSMALRSSTEDVPPV